MKNAFWSASSIHRKKVLVLVLRCKVLVLVLVLVLKEFESLGLLLVKILVLKLKSWSWKKSWLHHWKMHYYGMKPDQTRTSLVRKYRSGKWWTVYGRLQMQSCIFLYQLIGLSYSSLAFSAPPPSQSISLCLLYVYAFHTVLLVNLLRWT